MRLSYLKFMGGVWALPIKHPPELTEIIREDVRVLANPKWPLLRRLTKLFWNNQRGTFR